MKTPEELAARAKEIRDGTCIHIIDALRAARVEDVQQDAEFAAFCARQGDAYSAAEVLELVSRVAKLLR